MRSRFALVAVALAAAFPSRAELRAERIREDTAAELQIGGPDAIGGVGDWYLANDVVEAIVDDPARAHGKLNHGGTIVDLGLRDRRGEDQFARLFPIANLSQRVELGYDAIRAEVSEAEGWARLVVTSPGMRTVPRRNGLLGIDPLVPHPKDVRDVRVETEYAVLRGEPFVHIVTTFHNTGSQPASLFAFGDVWMRGGRSMRSFVGNAFAPERTSGFAHGGFDPSAMLFQGGALDAFTHVSIPGVRHFPPIAYALLAPERAAQGRPLFGTTGEHVNLAAAFVRDPDWNELGLVRMAGGVVRRLPPGETWSVRRRLLVTGHPDVASTTDVVLPLLGIADGKSGIAGAVEPADLPCSVHVETVGGVPVTQALTHTTGAEAGRYRAVLPPGEYTLTFQAPQRAPRRADVRVEPGAFAEPPLQRFEEAGWLVFAPAFAGGAAGRIVVRGAEGTPDPVFGPELLDFRVGGERTPSGSETRALYFAGGADAERRVAVPPGVYLLAATRGFEHDAAEIRVEVSGPGAEVRVPPFALRRVIELRGIASADLHVHAQASDDSATPNTQRLRAFVAEGVDILVTSDHDNLGNYEPALDALALRDRIHVLQGVEITSSAPSAQAPWTIGHHNAWPLTYVPHAHRHGAPPSQNRRVADLYAELRSDYGARVVQLNHPRDGKPGERVEGGFFTHLGTVGVSFDPTHLLDAEPNRRLLEPGADGTTRDIDFDAMEVMNGKRFELHRLIRDDWYALLRQDIRRTGTANSDTHGPDQPAGYPRNYVYLDDASEAWDAEAFDAAIRAGRLFGSSGPLIAAFTVNGARMGELAPAPDGRVEVALQVAAAPWVPVDEVRLVVDGETERTFRDLPRGEAGAVLRLRERVTLDLPVDAFVTVEAGAPLDAEPAAWAAAHPGLYTEAFAPGFVSAAFTNPIFVDADGNGRFDAPGRPLAPTTEPLIATTWLLPAAAAALGLWLFLRRRPVRVP